MPRLRQVALAVSDLEPACADLEAVFGLGEPFHDPGIAHFGLHNAVYAIGDTFLEVLAPVREGTTAGRYLQRRGGDSGYMVILQVPDLEAARGRAAEVGVPIVWEGGEDGARTIHLDPRVLGGSLTSLDWMDPTESWAWAGPGWEQRGATGCSAITGARMGCTDAAGTAARWSKLLDAQAKEAGHGEIAIELERSRVAFHPDADVATDGVTAIELVTDDPERCRAAAAKRDIAVSDEGITLAGVRFALV